METFENREIVGSLRYGERLPKVVKGLMYFSLLIALCFIAGGLYLFITEDNFYLKIASSILFIGAFGVCNFVICLLGFIRDYKIKLLYRRCAQAGDLRKSSANIRVLACESGRMYIKIGVVFKLDGNKIERKGKRYSKLFADYYHQYQKIDILYSPSLDEVLLLKMD